MDVDHCRDKEEIQINEISKEECENDIEDDEYLPAGGTNVPQTFNQQE